MSSFGVVKSAADEDITISANTSWNAGTYSYRDITVTNNATLTLNGTYSNDTDGTGVIVNARSITVTSGATISANGKGYAGGAGTGKGSAGNFGSGAGYGGAGGNGDTGNVGGISYGSTVKPLDLGSGGGNTGGAGGGAINLNLSENLVLAGTISSNGNNSGGWIGSGSGGSIYVVANNMSGNGTITANGGSVAGNADGGGGRIALYYNSTYSLDNSKVLASNGGGATDGSVFILDRGNKDLTVFRNLTLAATTGIDTNGDPTTDGTFNLRNLTVNNNASLIVGSKYTTDTDGSGLTFNMTGILTVASGSKIDAKGRGYAKGVGEGKGSTLNNLYGGGGSHGGDGGRAEGAAAFGLKYDSTLFPSKLGSGGATNYGGAGGGLIKVTATQIVVAGSLDASGAAGIVSNPYTGAGGGGGTIYLVASSISGNGTILADAGNSTGYSGGGGGGRIAIYADTSALTANNITAAKGLKGGGGASADGSVGTIFLYNTATGNVTASSDVAFDATQGVSRNGTARTDGVFYFNNLTVTNNATVTVVGTYTNDTNGRGVTINLDGNLIVDPGAKITSTGQGYIGLNGQGKGTGTTSTSGSGGSYGGVGGKSYNNNLAPAVYGTTQANFPSLLGSGGGNGDNGIGGQGGGAIVLRVLGSATNNGEISSTGATGTGGISGWRPGGGSGGSVFIICDSLSGAGTIWAKGGAGLGDANYGAGGGGGGRISVVYTTAQNVALEKFSAVGGAGGGSSTRDGAEGSVNITQRILPAAEFTLKNPNNNSTEFSNTENVEIVPADGTVEKFKEAASVNDLVPTFYADGWANVTDGKDVGVAEGTKTVRAWFKDGNELISSSIGSATITLDTTNPELTINNNNSSTESSQATVNLTFDDNLSGIDYITLNGERKEINALGKVSESTIKKNSNIKALAAERSYETTVDVAVGENTIPIVIFDKASNSASKDFVVTRTEVIPSPTPSPTDSQVASITTIPLNSVSSPNSFSREISATDNNEIALGNGTPVESAETTVSQTPGPLTDATKLTDQTSQDSDPEKSKNNTRLIIYSILIVVGFTIIALLFRARKRHGGKR